MAHVEVSAGLVEVERSESDEGQWRDDGRHHASVLHRDTPTRQDKSELSFQLEYKLSIAPVPATHY